MCGTIIDCVAKVIIFVTNVITLIVSLLILGGMIYAMVGLNIMDMLEVFGQSDMSVIMYSMYGFLGLLLITSLLGIFGVCCKSKLLLGLYAVILMICLLGMGIVTVLWFLEGDNIMTNAEEQMGDTIFYQYEGDYSTDPISIAWNLIQYQLATCGVKGYTDYVNSEWSNGTFSSNTFDFSGGAYTAYTLPFPVSCCDGGDKIVTLSKLIAGKVNANTFANEQQWVLDCYGITDNGDGTYTQSGTATPNTDGSLNKTKDVLKASIYIVAGIAAGIVLLQLLLVWAGCRLIDSPRFGKGKVDAEEKE